MFTVNFNESDNEEDDTEANWGLARLYGGADHRDRWRRASSMSGINFYSDDEESFADSDDDAQPRRRKWRKVRRWMRLTLLVAAWLFYTAMLSFNHEHEVVRRLICVSVNEPRVYRVYDKHVSRDLINIGVKGPFMQPTLSEPKSPSPPLYGEGGLLSISVERVIFIDGQPETLVLMPEPWQVRLVPTSKLDIVEPVMLVEQLELSGDIPHNPKNEQFTNSQLQLIFRTDIDAPVAFQMRYRSTPVPLWLGGTVSLLLLLALVGMIMAHVCNFTLAAMFISTLAIAVLAIYHLRPSLPLLVGWIHIDMLLIIFSMTIIAAIFADAGFFDLVVFQAYLMANGHIWPMLNCIIVVAIASAVLFGTIVTVLLLTPILIRYCEALELDPVPSLVILIMFTAYGASFLPVDDSLRSSLANENDPIMEAVTFGTYVTHMVPGILVVVVHTYIHIRLRFIDSSRMRFTDLHRLQRVIRVWKHTAKQISGYSKDEQTVRDTVLMKVRRLRHRVRRLGKMPEPVADFEQRRQQLQTTWLAHDNVLFYMSIAVLLLFIVIFSVHHAPGVIHLTRGWITVLAFVLLFILVDMDEIDGILARIDWSSMFFLATMCILMEAMLNAGLFDWLISWMSSTIASCTPAWRLTVALMLILWVSGITSALFVEHSFLKIMLPLVIEMTELKLDLPLQPLLWAFMLGTVAGNAGTVIGAAANVVCAGVAEKHDYNMSFTYFFKIAVPIMLLNMVLLSAYLLIAHVAYTWH